MENTRGRTLFLLATLILPLPYLTYTTSILDMKYPRLVIKHLFVLFQEVLESLESGALSEELG